MLRHRLFTGIVVLCLGVMAALPAAGQEARGTILGRVTDPQGAVVPGASVVITNIETNSVARTTTNATGYYEVPLLPGGRYTISVELSGFKKTVRGPVELSVGSRLEITVELAVGNIAETVTVTAEAPLLETTSASGGRVIDTRHMIELPYSDMNPFALTGLAAGMQWTGQPEYRRPFDNGGTSAFNTAGGIGQNEYGIDGATVTGTGRRVGFVPPSDAIAEFKMETANFDASVGHTSGAFVNVSTKSGTNDFHGSLYDQHWQQRWNATPHFTRLLWENQVAQGKISKDSQKQATGRSNQFGGTIGGPVRIPKLYNGRDKFFFFFSYNGIYQNKAETTDSINRTVPKMAWRTGDFSDLLALDPKYQIYDPRTARLSGNNVIRDPFPGNKGIPILNPMYSFYAKVYPQPNNVPGLVTPEGSLNYYGSAMPKNERFNSILQRTDYAFNERHKISAKWYWNHRLADEYDWTYETMRGLHTNGLTRINKGGSGDYVWSISGSTILNVTVAYQRFNEGAVQPVPLKFKPSDVGLPAYLDQRAGDLRLLPRIDISNIESVSAGYPAINIRGSTGTLRAALTKVSGRHSVNLGWDERRYWTTTAGPGYTSGRFQFNNSYMRSSNTDNTALTTGLSWAAFMMGMPNSMSIDGNDSALWSTPWHSFWAQDDLRLTSRLRLSFGLRFEWEQGISERFNRAWAGGFDFNYRYPFSDAVEAAYAKNPLAELPASQFKVQGAGYFMGQQGKGWTDGARHYLPRAGVVYQISPRTVIRAGYGWYADTFNPNNDRPSQDGFSQGTSTVITTDSGLSYCCGVNNQPIPAAALSASNTPLSNPFAVRADGTRFDTPYRNTLGGVYFAGRGYTYYPRNYLPPRQQRWRVGLQRQFSHNLVLDVSYNGAWSRIPAPPRINYLPQKYFDTGNVRNNALQQDMDGNVPAGNPFNTANFASLASNTLVWNYLRTQGTFTGTNISKATLLRLIPAMRGTFAGLRPGQKREDVYGGVRYHDLQVQVEKRFARGFSTTGLYTYANSESQNWYMNEYDTTPSWQLNNNTRPHRFVWSGIYEFPFGKGRRFVSKGPIQHVLGGWSVGWIYQRNSGQVLGFGDRFFYGDITKLADLLKHDQVNSKDIHVWFDPSISYGRSGTAQASDRNPIPSGFVGFEGRSAFQPTYHARVLPANFSDLRGMGIANWDVNVKRDFRIKEGFKARFQVDLLNATNHTNFDNPNTDVTSSNFGRITTQRGLSRTIQFNLRLQF